MLKQINKKMSDKKPVFNWKCIWCDHQAWDIIGR